jgi:protein-disulfide isomerase
VPASKSIVILGALVLAVAMSYAVRTTQQQNQQILDELAGIRQLLEKAVPDIDRVKLDTISGDFLGKPDAPLTMVEFTDLQCPYCRQFHATVFEQIKTEYIDTGKLRYYTRDFPLDTIHPLAVAALRAARCAGEQGRFWEMRHSILSHDIKADSFKAYAREMHLDSDAFNTCVADTTRIDAQWQRDKELGTGLGVSGTPSFVIGRSASKGLEGIRFEGAKPFSVFDAKFKDILSASN